MAGPKPKGRDYPLSTTPEPINSLSLSRANQLERRTPAEMKANVNKNKNIMMSEAKNKDIYQANQIEKRALEVAKIARTKIPASKEEQMYKLNQVMNKKKR
jgi:hypothetical protein